MPSLHVRHTATAAACDHIPASCSGWAGRRHPWWPRRAVALLTTAFALFCASPLVAQRHRARNSCYGANGDIVHVQWRLQSDTLPCETTLHTGALVRVMVRGANPAVAEYSLRSAAVTVDSFAAGSRSTTLPDTSAQAIASPA